MICPYTFDDLTKHRIRLIPEEEARKRLYYSRVQLMEIHNEGEFATYKVEIGRFQLIINLLNQNIQKTTVFNYLNQNIQETTVLNHLRVMSIEYDEYKDHKEYDKYDNYGKCGRLTRIFRAKMGGTYIIIKKETTTVGKIKIERLVMEAAIAKLCSLLKIGPKAELNIPIDLDIHNNAVVFHMEMCDSLS
jgi:hypothetical protein